MERPKLLEQYFRRRKDKEPTVPNEISDRNVFILGAGFSASAGAPVINDFLDVSREIFDNPDSALDDAEKELFRQVFEFKKRVAQAREKFRIDLDNIEPLFGLIEMSHGLEKRKDARDAMVYVIAKTLQLAIAKNQQRQSVRVSLAPGFENTRPAWAESVPRENANVVCPDIYTHFGLLLSGKYDAPNKSRSNVVITFNYDLILDDALCRIGVEPIYGLPDCDVDGIPPQEGGVSVLKLHGSTNWAICPRCRKVHIAGVKFTGDPAAFRARPCARCHKPGLHLLLVPPSWDKSEYRVTMRPVWKQAVDALKTANRICVIGYSMPETDTFFKFLLTLGLAENHQLYRFVLVDKLDIRLAGDLSSEPEPTINIEARYKDMFETLFVKRRFEFSGDGFAGFLPNLGSAMGRAETIRAHGLIG
jgi:NAD-dependent SIR2 family protein deacetylase